MPERIIIGNDGKMRVIQVRDAKESTKKLNSKGEDSDEELPDGW